jgi:hypothetical protein
MVCVCLSVQVSRIEGSVCLGTWGRGRAGRPGQGQGQGREGRGGQGRGRGGQGQTVELNRAFRVALVA